MLPFSSFDAMPLMIRALRLMPARDEAVARTRERALPREMP